MPKLICAEVNEIFRNLCRSSCAEVLVPKFTRDEVRLPVRQGIKLDIQNLKYQKCLLFIHTAECDVIQNYFGQTSIQSHC